MLSDANTATGSNTADTLPCWQVLLVLLVGVCLTRGEHKSLYLHTTGFMVVFGSWLRMGSGTLYGMNQRGRSLLATRSSQSLATSE
jgi:hypothetical protein